MLCRNPTLRCVDTWIVFHTRISSLAGQNLLTCMFIKPFFIMIYHILTFLSLPFSGKNGDDGRMWSVFASSERIRYRYLDWNEWNQSIQLSFFIVDKQYIFILFCCCESLTKLMHCRNLWDHPAKEQQLAFHISREKDIGSHWWYNGLFGTMILCFHYQPSKHFISRLMLNWHVAVRNRITFASAALWY